MNPENNEAVEAEKTTVAAESATEQPETEKAEGSTEGSTEGNTEAKKEEGEALPFGVKKRFATLTKRNRDYENQISVLKNEQAQLKQAIEEFASSKPKPTRESFENDEQYIAYLASEEANRIYQKKVAEPQRLHQSALEAQNQKMAEWNEKVSESFEDPAEFSKVVSAADAPMPKAVLGAIMDSDEGPKIAYYLAKNPAEAEKVSSLDGKRLERAMLKLEIKLEDANLQDTQKANVSQAPAPMGRPADTSLSNAPSSIEDWIKARQKKIYG